MAFYPENLGGITGHHYPLWNSQAFQLKDAKACYHTELMIPAQSYLPSILPLSIASNH